MTYYNDELYHYGVLGMKWGVRRKRYDKYVQKAEKREAKAAEALAKGQKHKYFWNSDRAKDFRYMADTAKRMNEEKGFIARRQAKYGYNAQIAQLKNKADKMADRGQNRRFKLTRAKALKNESIIRRKQNVLNAYANTPIRTMGGRMRTADQKEKERKVSKLIGGIASVPVGVAASVFGASTGYKVGKSFGNMVTSMVDIAGEWKGYRKNNH